MNLRPISTVILVRNIYLNMFPILHRAASRKKLEVAGNPQGNPTLLRVNLERPASVRGVRRLSLWGESAVSVSLMTVNLEATLTVIASYRRSYRHIVRAVNRQHGTKWVRKLL